MKNGSMKHVLEGRHTPATLCALPLFHTTILKQTHHSCYNPETKGRMNHDFFSFLPSRKGTHPQPFVDSLSFILQGGEDP